MSNEELERQYQAFVDKYEKRLAAADVLLMYPMNVQFAWYRTFGKDHFERGLKEDEQDAMRGYVRGSLDDEWQKMRDKDMTVKEYLASNREVNAKQNTFVSARIENGNTLYIKTTGGDEHKVKFRPFDAEDGEEEFKRYSWETDNGDDHLLTIFYGYDLEYEINDARQFSLPITVEQGNALRAQLDEYVANELGGGRRRRRQRRKTRRTKVSRRRRQTRARRVRN